MTGSAVQWLRDQLGIIASASEIEALAQRVPDNGGVYFVPAFSGLFAPYWRSDARGAIVGLSRFNTKAHLARATLEAICFQTRAVLDAMVAGLGRPPRGAEGRRRRDGQRHADAAAGRRPRRPGRPPGRRRNDGARRRLRGGLAVGFWKDLDDLRENWRMDKRWEPAGRRTGGRRPTASGRRPSIAVSTGSSPLTTISKIYFIQMIINLTFRCPRHTMVNVRRDVGLVGTVIFIVRLQDG